MGDEIQKKEEAVVPPAWALKAEHDAIFVEDDALPPDAPTADEVWKRLFGAPFDRKKAKETFDVGDAVFHLMDGGVVFVASWRGACEIRRVRVHAKVGTIPLCLVEGSRVEASADAAAVLAGAGPKDVEISVRVDALDDPPTCAKCRVLLLDAGVPADFFSRWPDDVREEERVGAVHTDDCGFHTEAAQAHDGDPGDFCTSGLPGVRCRCAWATHAPLRRQLPAPEEVS